MKDSIWIKKDKSVTVQDWGCGCCSTTTDYDTIDDARDIILDNMKAMRDDLKDKAIDMGINIDDFMNLKGDFR